MNNPQIGRQNRLSDFIALILLHQGREEEAETILRRIYLPREVEREIEDLRESIQTEIREQWSTEKVNLFKLWKTAVVRRGLIAGVGLQVFQQFVGINTVMYYSPTIVQLVGFASNQTALLLSTNLGEPHLSLSPLFPPEVLLRNSLPDEAFACSRLLVNSSLRRF